MSDSWLQCLLLLASSFSEVLFDKAESIFYSAVHCYRPMMMQAIGQNRSLLLLWKQIFMDTYSSLAGVTVNSSHLPGNFFRGRSIRSSTFLAGNQIQSPFFLDHDRIILCQFVSNCISMVCLCHEKVTPNRYWEHFHRNLHPSTIHWRYRYHSVVSIYIVYCRSNQCTQRSSKTTGSEICHLGIV